MFGVLGVLGLTLVQPTDTQGFLSRDWAPATGELWSTMAMLAIFLTVGSIWTALAYQNAPPALISPLDFTYVGFALIWSWMFYAELPNAGAAVGIVLIVCAGILAVSGGVRPTPTGRA